jgi:hypothetical protein
MRRPRATPRLWRAFVTLKHAGRVKTFTGGFKMLDLNYLKQHPQSATPEQVLELIRLVELSRSTLPDYSEARPG